MSEANTSLTENTWISQGGTAYRGKVSRERKYAAPKTYTLPASTSGSQTARILLKGKLQLPEGFGSEARVHRTDRAIEQHISNLSLNDSEDVVPEVDGFDNDQDDSEGERSDDEENADNYENGENSGPGRRKETAEEKKLRKQRIKAEKRTRRGLKKQLKIAYKSEYLNQVAKRSSSQDINSVRVYKYTV